MSDSRIVAQGLFMDGILSLLEKHGIKAEIPAVPITETALATLAPKDVFDVKLSDGSVAPMVKVVTEATKGGQPRYVAKLADGKKVILIKRDGGFVERGKAHPTFASYALKDNDKALFSQLVDGPLTFNALAASRGLSRGQLLGSYRVFVGAGYVQKNADGLIELTDKGRAAVAPADAPKPLRAVARTARNKPAPKAKAPAKAVKAPAKPRVRPSRAKPKNQGAEAQEATG